jgi:hypothetical protein
MFGWLALCQVSWKTFSYHPKMLAESGFDSGTREHHVAKDLSRRHDLSAEHPDKEWEVADHW